MLPALEREKILSGLTEKQYTDLAYDWKFWARPSQLPPPGDWDGWLILAGRGFGKSRTGAEFVRAEVEAGRAKRIALIGETSADGRGVMVTGPAGLLSVCPPWNMPVFVAASSLGRPQVTWANGAVATLYDAREPDQLRGPQHDLAWLDEGAKYRYAQAVFDQLMFGLRLGSKPRWVMTTTPRPIPLITGLLKDSRVAVTRGNTSENLQNLAPSYVKNVVERYQGTRLGRQELNAEILDDVPGALWTRRVLEECRRTQEQLPQLTRLMVAVDPSATSGEESNEAGIIVVGTGRVDGYQHGYVLDDWSVQGTPDEWARRAVAAYRFHSADRIIAEKNQGGEMVEHVIKSVDRNVPVTLVTATRGKVVRAEPISALYEQGRIHHVGSFPVLEDQMIMFTRETSLARADGYSPDRVDAMVWGFSELFDLITSAKRDADRPPPGRTNSGYSHFRHAPVQQNRR